MILKDIPFHINKTFIVKCFIQNCTNFIFFQLRTVWVSCDGETVADKELIGPISYNPRPGFPGYFFPFENAEGYLSPLVAVQFKRPHSMIYIV